MAIGTHKVPKETKEATTKWAKFFSTGQLAVLIVQIIIDYWFFSVMSEVGLQMVALFIDLAATLLVGVIIMGTMPPSKYLFGSGLPLWKIVIRYFARKFKHKYIYVRGYAANDDTEEKGEDSKWHLSGLFQNM